MSKRLPIFGQETASAAAPKAPAARKTFRREDFLPVSRADMERRGWDEVDFVFVTGDAYVDHPSFANGVLSRVLESAGYKVGMIAQPDFKDPDAENGIARFGRPRLGFLVGAGNLDSSLSAYTAHKLPRSSDEYSPGGKAGLRPVRATIVYCNLIRRRFGKVPIVIGGIEASQRRFSHYDYWEDRVRRSVLLDSNADLLVFGMGESPLLEIAERLAKGERPGQITDVRGTCYVKKDVSYLRSTEYTERFGEPVDVITHDALLPPKGDTMERVQERQPDPDAIPQYRRNYALAFKQIHDLQDPVGGKPLIQKTGELSVVQLPPATLQKPAEMDRWYDLPYTRVPHPDYERLGGVPAWLTTQHTIVTHRGCMATCTFCAITMHQGRTIQSRSQESILKEAAAITQMQSFKGTISDVGGPSANMYGSHCKVQQTTGSCTDRDCLAPEPCPALKQELGGQLEMLEKVRNIPGVKKAFIASGIRYDLLLDERGTKGLGEKYIENLAEHHVSGQLKVAPEHTDDEVLKRMHKPSFKKYEEFKDRFLAASERVGKEQYLTAYFVSSHPGCSTDKQIGLAEYFHCEGWSPEQVQDFIPTPMTAATAMFYSGIDPDTGEVVFTPTTMREKRRQRALMQYKKPEMQGRVRKALREAGRTDLIGRGPRALVPEGPEQDWADENPRYSQGVVGGGGGGGGGQPRGSSPAPQNVSRHKHRSSQFRAQAAGNGAGHGKVAKRPWTPEKPGGKRKFGGGRPEGFAGGGGKSQGQRPRP